MTSVTQEAPRRRLTGDQRREALLAAALEVFSRRGYHAASIDEIARAAEVSKALIYEHFDSKRDLHGSLLEAHAGELFARLQASVGVEGEPDERLRHGFDTFFAFVEERQAAWLMMFRDAAEPEVADQFQRVQAQATGLVVALMTTDPDLAAIAPGNELLVEMLAVQLSGAMQGLAFWWLENRKVPREALVDAAMDFAWTGMERVRTQVAS